MEKTRQWLVLTAVGAVAILVAGWFLVASPQHKHAAALRTQANNLTASNQQLQVQVHQRQVEQAGVTVEQRKLDKIAQQIPDNPALPTLIRQLSSAAEAAGVDLVSLAPSQPVPATAGATSGNLSARSATTGSLVQIPVAVQVTGGYFNVEAFFNAIEKMTRVMKVPSWTMAPFSGSAGAPSTTATGSSGSSGATLPGSVTTTISGLIYEMPVVAVAPATAPVATGGSSTGSSTSKPATGTNGTTGTSSSTGGTTSSSTSSSTSSNGQ